MCPLVTENKTRSKFIRCCLWQTQQYEGAAQCPCQQQHDAAIIAVLTTRAPIACFNGANTWNKTHSGGQKDDRVIIIFVMYTKEIQCKYVRQQ